MSVAAAKVPVYVTAFHADGTALDALLQRLKRELPGVPLGVLGSENAELASVAGRHGVPWRAALPPQVEDTRYWCAVLEALNGEQGPLIVLRCGTQLPPYWYGRLLPRSAHLPALQFPLGLRHPATSIFADPAQPCELDVAALDIWLNLHAPGIVFDLPVLSGWTAWLQPQRCLRVKATDDASLARALIEAGETVLATDAVAVDDGAFAPQGLPGTYTAWRAAQLHHHPLAIMRHAMGEHAQRAETPPADLPATQPVRLHLSHGWGGGLWRWVEDFCNADTNAHNLILKPVGEPDGFGKSLVLLAADGNTQLASWTLARPILSTALVHHEYAALLREVMGDWRVNEIVVSSLIGHSLDALHTGLPTTLVLHDFYPLCPLVMASWEGPCSQCSDARLADCLQHNPAQRFFDNEPDSYWQTLRQRFVALVRDQPISLVAPTPSVARRWQQLSTQLPAERFQVIAHGLPVDLVGQFMQARKTVRRQPGAGRPLKLVVLGSLESHKGGQLLLAALPALTAHADLVLLGPGKSGETFQGQAGVQVVPGYRREQLGELLAETEADLGLVLSTVPETFSYTLSELQAAGLPVIATALGALADRITPEWNGWLIEPDAEALLAQIQALARDPQRITGVRETLLAQTPRDARNMVADYGALHGGQLALEVRARPHAGRLAAPAGIPVPVQGAPIAESALPVSGEHVRAGLARLVKAPLRLIRRLLG